MGSFEGNEENEGFDDASVSPSPEVDGNVESAKSDKDSGLARRLKEIAFSAIDKGVGPIDSPSEWASKRLAAAGGDVEAAVDRIVRESVMMAGTNGAVTSVGGIFTTVVLIPANVAGMLAINVRMVAAIAFLRGYSLSDLLVRHAIVLTAAGTSAQAALSEIGIKIAKKSAEVTLKRIPAAAFRAINKKVGFQLVTKYGAKRGVVVAAKAIPVIAAGVGAVIDGASTALIASLAKKEFPPQNPRDDEGAGVPVCV